MTLYGRTEDNPPEEEFLEKEQTRVIREAINTLPKRTADIIIKICGFYEEPKTYRELGKEYGISGGRIGQIYHHGLRLLRHESRSYKIKAYSPWGEPKIVYY